MRYRLRTLLIVVVALSIALAVARMNVIDFEEAFGSHPAELLGVFAHYRIVWGVAFGVSLVLGIISRGKAAYIPAAILCVLSGVGLITNTVMPLGMM